MEKEKISLEIIFPAKRDPEICFMSFTVRHRNR